MFDLNYDNNYEIIVKKFGKTIYLCGIIMMSIAALLGIFLLAINSSLWYIALLLVFMGVATGIGLMLAGHLVWGFADMVSRLKKI